MSTPIAADQLARDEHVGHVLASADRHDIGRRLVLGHVLVARQHPRDLLQVDAVLVGQDATRPHAGGDGVAAIDADLHSFEILRRLDAGLGVAQDRAVMELPHQRHRDRRHRLAVLPRADVGRDRHLADVELGGPHLPTERGDQRVDLDELRLERCRLDDALLERAVVALGAGDRLELWSGHLSSQLHHMADRR